MTLSHGPQEPLRGVPPAGRRLVESTPGATLKGVVADLGVVRGTLRHWVDLHATGENTAPVAPPRSPRVSAGGDVPPAGSKTPQEKVARLRPG